MCTLTFIPTDAGYAAGMNRDELLTRPAALAPEIHKHGESESLVPSEPSGGTWIACNSFGNTLALLNWNAVDARSLGEKRKTRGFVIPELINEADSSTTLLRFQALNLVGVFPFRLVGIFRQERILIECRWDGVHKQNFSFPWTRKHWFSSSISDSFAKRERARVCEAAADELAVSTNLAIRNLHRSHLPAPGPFSICVHRPDASTVSYTELTCSPDSIEMRYAAGSPCLKDSFDAQLSLALKRAATSLSSRTANFS